MNDTPNLDYLRDQVDKLKRLLDDPHPGLMTWRQFYADRMKAISDFWNADDARAHKETQFNPHIENLRQFMVCLRAIDPGGTAVCNAGLDAIAERLATLEADNLMLVQERAKLREACEDALRTITEAYEIASDRRQSERLLRAALSCKQEPKPA